MKFPVSVEIIDDQIVLYQGQITVDFRRLINSVPVAETLGYCRIYSASTPDLATNTIFINGSDIYANYRFASIMFTTERYEKYINSIEFYKRKLGYDE